MSYAGDQQQNTRGKRQKARDLEELEALEEAQAASRTRMVAQIRTRWDEICQAEGFTDENGQLIYSERLIRYAANTGMATLHWLAEAGDREAARVLVDRLLGQPDLPYSEKVKQLSEEEAMGQIEFILGTRFSNLTIDGITAAFRDPPPPLPSGE